MTDVSTSGAGARQRAALVLLVVAVVVVITATALVTGGARRAGGAAAAASSSGTPSHSPAAAATPSESAPATSVRSTSTQAPGPPATAKGDQDAGALVGSTWYLQSVTENGRTWRPLTDRPSTLIMDSSTTATTADGANDESWTVAVDGSSSVWTAGMSTAVGEDARSAQVGLALEAILGDRPTWRVDAGRLTWIAADGSALTYSRTPLPPVPSPTGISVYLDLDPAGGTIARGSMLNLGRGAVTVRKMDGPVVARFDVTKDDMGLTILPPGQYEVGARASGSTCRAQRVTVGRVGVVEVGLVCVTGAAAQHG